MSQAILPKERETQTLADLKAGERAWTVPWAISVDMDGRMWLTLAHAQWERRGGTIQLLITHEADDTWSAVLYDGYTWRKVDKGQGVPVAAFSVRQSIVNS